MSEIIFQDTQDVIFQDTDDVIWDRYGSIIAAAPTVYNGLFVFGSAVI